jgi:hypothetical protein
MMMHALKLTQVGDAIGLLLPQDVLAKLKRGQGETVFLIETEHGLVLSAQNPAILAQLEAGREFLRDFGTTYRALAK